MDAEPTINLDSRVIPSADALVQPTGDEAVLLDVATECYFGLNPVGTRLWMLLGKDPHLGHAHRQLLAEYDVDAVRLEKDLVAMVHQLLQAGLVRLG